MKIKYIKHIALIALSVLILAAPLVIAKGKNTYKADKSEETKKTKKTEGDFVKGAQVWVNNCTRCHNMRNPADYSDQEWRLIVAHMRIRASLTGQEARDVLKFLQNSN